MRQDKMTTKFQEALADAQSLAVGGDNQYIEPVHLLSALLNHPDAIGGPRSSGRTRAAAVMLSSIRRKGIVVRSMSW